MTTTGLNQAEIKQPLTVDGFESDLTNSDSSQPMPATDESLDNESWFRRNSNSLKVAGVGAYLGAVALTYNQLGEVKDQVFESAHWTIPAIAVTETVATAGLAAMVAATGSKIGNPMTFRKRIKGFQGKLTNSSMFRTGAYLNLAGAAGTSAVIAGETIADLPQNAWPAALGVAGLSTALSLPFYKIARDKRAELGAQQ